MRAPNRRRPPRRQVAPAQPQADLHALAARVISVYKGYPMSEQEWSTVSW
jgi:hypothetical protein